MSSIWSTWNTAGLTATLHQKYPDSVFVGNIPLFGLIIAGVATLLMFYFSDRIYKWDVRVMYGRVLDKLEGTISEMEKLKHG
jgi:hypothetical protein